MKILVAVMMTALCVFAIATAWVDYVQPQLDLVARAKQQAPATEREPVAKKKSRNPRVVDDDEELLPVPSDDLADTDDVPRKPAKSRISRLRPEQARSLLKEQLDEVKERETRVAERQDSLRMMYDDIRTELAMLDDIRKQASEELLASERGRTEAARRAASRENIATADRLPSLSDSPDDLKEVSARAANRSQAFFIKRLVDDGNEKTAVTMLKSMKGREAARVLDSLHTISPRLAQRLADTVAAYDGGSVRR